MSLEVIGKLHKIYETQQIKDTFSKREFILELTDESPSGMVYTNYASFQLVNNSCSVIDQFQPGETLKVSFNIRGNRWEKPDGAVKYITNLNAWRVERATANSGGIPTASNSATAAPSPNTTPTNDAADANSASHQASNDDAKDDDLPF